MSKSWLNGDLATTNADQNVAQWDDGLPKRSTVRMLPWADPTSHLQQSVLDGAITKETADGGHAWPTKTPKLLHRANISATRQAKLRDMPTKDLSDVPDAIRNELPDVTSDGLRGSKSSARSEVNKTRVPLDTSEKGGKVSLAQVKSEDDPNDNKSFTTRGVSTTNEAAALRCLDVLNTSYKSRLNQRADDSASSISGATTATSETSRSRTSCHVCRQPLTNGLGSVVRCASCSRSYHSWCVPNQSKTNTTESWQCKSCIRKDVPLKSPSSSVSSFFHDTKEERSVEDHIAKRRKLNDVSWSADSKILRGDKSLHAHATSPPALKEPDSKTQSDGVMYAKSPTKRQGNIAEEAPYSTLGRNGKSPNSHSRSKSRVVRRPSRTEQIPCTLCKKRLVPRIPSGMQTFCAQCKDNVEHTQQDQGSPDAIAKPTVAKVPARSPKKSPRRPKKEILLTGNPPESSTNQQRNRASSRLRNRDVEDSETVGHDTTAASLWDYELRDELKSNRPVPDDNIDDLCSSLFDEWPEYHPANCPNPATKLAEIAKRPKRKQLFGKSTLLSRLGTMDILEPQQYATRTDLEPDAGDRVTSTRNAERSEREGVVTVHYDNIEDFLGVKDDLVPTIHEGKLYYRDVRKNANGTLSRATFMCPTGI